MNFGFTFGDANITEPYFYVTAYPQPEAFPSLELPPGTTWNTAGFNGALVTYETLAVHDDGRAYLLGLSRMLLSAGRRHMLAA